MKTALYLLIQKITRLSLYCYFREIQLHGLDEVPRNRPVLFLANHQNALLDPLIIAACTDLRPYFLTRSDVFTNTYLSGFFQFLRMLPIYRLRDGRNTLTKNEAVFAKCTRLLEQQQAIFLFPEANHNLQRRVRPLSKGFTRIICSALDTDPSMDLYLVPIGINYENASAFPDRVAYYFGRAISARDLYDPNDLQGSIAALKQSVFEGLKKGTTHIEDLERYETIHSHLLARNANFLKPQEVNQLLKDPFDMSELPPNSEVMEEKSVSDYAVMVLNAPVFLIWRLFFKKRIEEKEFISTYRFAYLFFAMPIYYGLLWLALLFLFPTAMAALLLTLHFLYNLWYVKRTPIKKAP
jgi:1-acyl-sn-glycerol-3-phosphate acyltransferase